MSNSSILDGVDDYINQKLGLQLNNLQYKHKKSCQLLSKQPPSHLDGKAFVDGIYERIGANWSGQPSRSFENWRDEPQDRPSSDGSKLEVTLERRIVGCQWPDSVRWFNQVPVASGLVNSVRDKKRAIDLVHLSKMNNGQYEFIELKVAQKSGGTPLLAAMEILQYGALYIFSRKNASKLGYDIDKKVLLKARDIKLVVLAPATYYKGYWLGWLKDKINEGIKHVLEKENVQIKMEFAFQEFPATFDPRSLPDDLAIMRALNARTPVMESNSRSA